MDSSFVGKMVAISSEHRTVYGEVKQVTDNTVMLDDGETLVYFYLRSIVHFSTVKSKK